MESQGLQNLVKNIFGDETAKASFLANPRAFLSNLKLSEAEKTAALNLHSRLGLATAGSAEIEGEVRPLTYWF